MDPTSPPGPASPAAQIIALLQAQTLNAAPPAPTDTRPIRAEDIYDFTPSDSADDYDYHIFTGRFYDMVVQYNEQCVLPSLVSCLKNERARIWYTSLSNMDKTLLRTAVANWMTLLIRDFGIKPFRAKQLAQWETFSFAQRRPVLKYFKPKLACLKIACIKDPDMQCSEIRDRIKDPEFHTVIHLKEANNTTVWLCQELMDLETDCRALWQKC